MQAPPRRQFSCFTSTQYRIIKNGFTSDKHGIWANDSNGIIPAKLNLRRMDNRGDTSKRSPLIPERKLDISNGNLRNLVAGDLSGCQSDCCSGATHRREGFERIGIREKLNFYNIARASGGETRSLLYVIEDNYPEYANECAAIREETIQAGRKITGLISSFKKRQAFITISALFTLATVTSFFFIVS